MNKTQNPFFYIFKKMWHYSDDRKKIILYLVMSWISNLVHLCVPLIFALLLNELQKNGITHSNVYYLVFLSFLFVVRSLLTWSFHGPSRLMERSNAYLTRANAKIFLLGGTLKLPLEWHTEHHSGDTIDKIEKGGNGLSGFAENTFRVLGIVNSMLFSFLALMFFNFGAAMIALAIMFLTVSIIVKFDRVLVVNYQILNRMENKISEKVVDVITNVNTVIILRIEKLLLEAMKKKIMEPFDLFRKTNRREECKWFLVSLCVNTTTFVALSYYLISGLYWEIPVAIGTFFAIYGYTSQVADSFFDLAGFYGDVLRWRAGVANSEELAANFKALSSGNINGLANNWQELRVEEVNFSYHTEDNADLHLENIYFSAKRGQKIALAGHSGSGKSTWLKILRELYQPQTGKIYLDNKELPDGFSAISSQITLIPQEPEIFATTILENITMGVDYEMDKVRRYTDLACFGKVVENLPKKFDSSIKEKGVNLSGGEKQRLALARGLLACEDKSIVLLDEPTSSVDIETEIEIHQKVFRAFVDKTIISSVHRLPLLSFFDQIYFFEDGRIIASGTLQELLKNSEKFRVLWSKYSTTTSAVPN